MTKSVIHMARKYLIYEFLSVLFALFGCGAPDNYQELSGNYFFRGGDGDGILSHKPDKMSIYGKVIQYKFNNDFIVVIQHPDYMDYKTMISSNLLNDVKKYPKNSTKDISMANREADSLLKYDTTYKKIFSAKENYWIISHKNEKTYGPLNEFEYMKIRKQLQVPQNLVLD